MQSNCKYYLIATTVLGALTFGSAAIHAQTTTVDTHIGPLKYEVGFPTKETVDKLYDEMDFQRACQAYLWSFPAVSFASVRAGLFRDLGATYNDIVLYQDFLNSKSIYLTGNSTTIYAREHDRSGQGGASSGRGSRRAHRGHARRSLVHNAGGRTHRPGQG